MTTEQFAQKVTDKFNEELTDLIFLYIENDAELMHDYLRLISDKDLDTVNKALGRKIKEKFGVENLERSNNPKSKLIQSYTKHFSK
ncbi:MAG: hypothetical protein ACYC25_14050 [Paludibacter sp.]